jgi:hypothetical protein
MIGMPVRYCPRCELRFTSRSELEDHLSLDHRPPARVAVSPASVVEDEPSDPSQPSPATTAVRDQVASFGPRLRTNVMGWLLLLVGLVIVAAIAWLASTPAAFIAAALVVAWAAVYRWRAWGRTLQPRAHRNGAAAAVSIATGSPRRGRRRRSMEIRHTSTPLARPTKLSVPRQSKPHRSRRTAANPDAPAKHRQLFSLRRRPRQSREPDVRTNLRAGVEAPHGYPFEPRF